MPGGRADREDEKAAACDVCATSGGGLFWMTSGREQGGAPALEGRAAEEVRWSAACGGGLRSSTHSGEGGQNAPAARGVLCGAGAGLRGVGDWATDGLHVPWCQMFYLQLAERIETERGRTAGQFACGQKQERREDRNHIEGIA